MLPVDFGKAYNKSPGELILGVDLLVKFVLDFYHNPFFQTKTLSLPHPI